MKSADVKKRKKIHTSQLHGNPYPDHDHRSSSTVCVCRRVLQIRRRLPCRSKFGMSKPPSCMEVPKKVNQRTKHPIHFNNRSKPETQIDSNRLKHLPTDRLNEHLPNSAAAGKSGLIQAKSQTIQSSRKNSMCCKSGGGGHASDTGAELADIPQVKDLMPLPYRF